MADHSLGRTDLEERVRRNLESLSAQALQRISEIDQELVSEEVLDRRSRVAVNVTEIAKSLAHLEKTLATENATAVDFVLSLHIDSISCSKEGRVDVRICKLGLVPDVVELIRNANAEGEATMGVPRVRPPNGLNNDAELVWHCTQTIRRRRSGEHAQRLVEFAIDPNRFVGLPSQFFWLDSFQVPKRVYWADAHADEVYEEFKKGGVSQAKLARDFGVSVPTIRKAIRIAQTRENGTGK